MQLSNMSRKSLANLAPCEDLDKQLRLQTEERKLMEGKARATGFEIDESYQNPPLPPLIELPCDGSRCKKAGRVNKGIGELVLYKILSGIGFRIQAKLLTVTNP